MKIAVSCREQSLESPIDPRFGRTEGFVIYDTDSGDWNWRANGQNLQLAQGAGLQTAQNVADAGAKAVITGHVGPKAFTALRKGGIDIYLVEGDTVAGAIENLKAGRLQPAEGPDRQGHW
ncbi:NifB/NifX family molybdenum-iron cluster-binding protein [Desulfohalovibrio reitneri]|uniref:NifB/NifX family molybdenum-iron cluster-binding protein n=1 Tax=Desulfohalovibrio reitneri TaxID=1307759 RepID=UPI0004A733B0|nr:NifB/NifX family molybdenum-iron cluster-binding protein [Desulfohalovibrio reitneri]